ncbi:UPF0223 family protein [Lactobacillaceae bacterium Melli_B4]
MKPNYQYPIFEDWSRDELTKVCKMYQLVEDTYELNQGVNREQLLNAYTTFKTIVPAKSEQRTLEREFESNSGYSIFKAIKAARGANSKNIKIDN